jgi:hypothetical protein
MTLLEKVYEGLEDICWDCATAVLKKHTPTTEEEKEFIKKKLHLD